MVSKVISSAVIYIISSGFTQLVSLLFTLVLMGELTIEEYGTYSLIAAFTAIFSFVIDGGLTGYIIKEFNNNKFDLRIGNKERNYFISNVFLYQFAATFVLLVCYFLVVLFIADSGIQSNYLAFGVTTLILGLSSPAFALLVANEKRQVVIVKDVCTALLRLVIVFTGFKIGLDYNFVYYIPLIAFIVSLIAMIYSYKRIIVGFEFIYFNFSSSMKSIFSLVFPFLMLALLNVLYTKIDFIMLSELSTHIEVAYYSGATIFVYPFLFVIAAANSAILPFLSRQNEIQPNRAKDEISIFKFMFIIGLVISTILFILSDAFYSNLFDGKYELSKSIYQILVWYLLIVFCYTAMTNLLVARGRIKLLIYMNGVMLMFNIGLNYLMIPSLGAKGAAIATIISELVILFFLWFMIYGKRVRDA
ncbi:hypothetical protein WH43_10490 [Rheinheimera sp. KL1]|uniref:oligosaccharide flippase family protein n=1 Tax=Rheinheimera sp. KL1 TaxID=1635005 RepID=UPI0006A9600A|nr:oligosaccharide flippase family protein [Rheinheimera sp. KL1]KOO58199.1 hypothetical protein WH43_10490 [Rheinheimera sp. KL1]